MTYVPETGGRPRPGAGFALWSWFFMRVSGVVLVLMVLFHLFWMHLVIGLNNINFDTIVGRWTGPLGPFWRMYDLIMLVLAFTHGMNGVRWVIEDYVRRRGWRLALNSLLAVVYLVVLLAGAYIIFSFPVME